MRKSLGCPTSIQKPSKSYECNCPSAQIAGKVSCSIEVGRNSMRLSTEGFRIYMPALMRFPTNSTGFSTKRSMRDGWLGLWTTTPYFEGSSTLVTTMVPSSPCFLWKAARSAKGYSQMTSEFRTKNGLSSFPRIASASLRGPAVPRGSDSMEKVILTLYLSSYYSLRSISSRKPKQAVLCVAYFSQILLHNLWTVVDS